MGLIVRLLGGVAIGLLLFIVVLVVAFVILFVVNRGLQLFAGFFGKEVGDFFGWTVGAVLKKFGFEKTKKKEEK